MIQKAGSPTFSRGRRGTLGIKLQVCRHSQIEGLGIQPIETLSGATTSLLISDGAKNKSGHAEFISASFECGIKTSKLVRFRNEFGMTKKNLSGANK